jgi:hypothetical protein
MPELHGATGALAIPIWGVGAVAAVFLVLIMLAVAQAGTATVMNTMFRAAIVIAVFSVGLIYLQQSDRQEQAAERRALEERFAALLGRAVAPGSALSCLNELAGDAIQAACEKAVFASPEAVSAAVSYVTAQLALLADGTEHARRVDAAFTSELAPLRTALELDRFGIVAHVLARRGCTAERCDALDWFNETGHVLANLRDHVFDDQVTKFTAVWNAPHPSADTVAAAVPAQAPMPHFTPVSPKYDFPSADSIPPVNIMVPETASVRNGTTASGQAAPADATKPGATPVPPRRPQSRPPAAANNRHPPAPPAHPAAPVAVGQAPDDGTAQPTSSGQSPQ